MKDVLYDTPSISKSHQNLRLLTADSGIETCQTCQIKNLSRKNFSNLKLLKEPTKFVRLKGLENMNENIKQTQIAQKLNDENGDITYEQLHEEDTKLKSTLHQMLNSVFQGRKKAFGNGPERIDHITSLHELGCIKRKGIVRDKGMSNTVFLKKPIKTSSRNLAAIACKVVSSLSKTLQGEQTIKEEKKELPLPKVFLTRGYASSEVEKEGTEHFQIQILGEEGNKIQSPGRNSNSIIKNSAIFYPSQATREDQSEPVTINPLFSNQNTAGVKLPMSESIMEFEGYRKNLVKKSSKHDIPKTQTMKNNDVTKLTNQILSAIPNPLIKRSKTKIPSIKKILEKVNKRRESHKDYNLPFNCKEQDHDSLKMPNQHLHATPSQIFKHEKFRELSHRNKVNDSLSLSENDEDMLRQLRESSYAINPDGAFKKFWDYLIFTIVLYTTLITPYYLPTYPAPVQMVILDCLFDLIFILDVFLNFFVAYYTYEEDLIKNLSLITINYLSCYFIIDVTAACPCNWILLSNDKDKYYPGYIFLIKFMKLVKMIKISRNERQYLNELLTIKPLNFSTAQKRMISFVIYFLIISHFITCLWIFIGLQEGDQNWIIHSKLSNAEFHELYISSLYFHWATIFTIGYGDVIATNTQERLYSSVLMFVGILIYSFTISSLGAMVTSHDNQTKKYHVSLNILESMNDEYDIPEDVYSQLCKYLKFNFKFNQSDNFCFINELPNRVKIQLLADMHKDTILHFRFFTEYSLEYSTRVVNLMKPRRVSRKEYLISDGELLEEIYFVKRGMLGIHLSAEFFETKVLDLMENEHFGDILIDSNERSPFILKVSSKTADLLILTQEDFNSIKEEFPEQLSDSISVSFYNYSSMLELAERKKIKIINQREEEKRRQAKRRLKEIPQTISSMKEKSTNSNTCPFIVGSDKHVQSEKILSSPAITLKETMNLLNNSNEHISQNVEYHAENSPNNANKMNMFNFNFIIQNNKLFPLKKRSTDKKRTQSTQHASPPDKTDISNNCISQDTHQFKPHPMDKCTPGNDSVIQTKQNNHLNKITPITKEDDNHSVRLTQLCEQMCTKFNLKFDEFET